MTMGCVRTFTRRMGGDITPCVAREGGDLRVGCSLICMVNQSDKFSWLWGDGDAVLWGDGTNVLTEQQ